MMSRSELRDLAELGARRKVLDIERQLDELQREFPNIFIEKDRPALLRAELRPTKTLTERGKSISARWTPERRARQAQLMKKRHPQLLRAKMAKAGKSASPKARKTKSKHKSNGATKNSGRLLWKDAWYERLKEHGPERVGESTKALGANDSAVLLTSAERYIKEGLIKRIKPGVYAVGRKTNGSSEEVPATS